MLNVAPEPAVNSQVYSHRPPARQDQGGSADDFGSMVDSNAAAADRDLPAPPPAQDKPARPADNNNDRSARRDDGNDADRAANTQPDTPRTGVFNQKPKKAPAHADSSAAKTGLSEGKSKPKLKDGVADDSATDSSPQKAGDVTNPNAVVVPAPATTAVTKPEGETDTAAETTPATDASAAVVAAATSKTSIVAGSDVKAAGAVAKPGIDPTAGDSSSKKPATDQMKASADGAAPVTTGDGADVAALSAGIVVPQQAAAAGATAVTTGVVKTDAVQGIANGKSAKTAAKTADTDGIGAKPGADAKSPDVKPTGDKSDASSAADTNTDGGKAATTSAKPDNAAATVASAHDRHSTDAPTAKSDISFQAALDLQAPSTQQTQTQQQFTVTAAGPTASAQAASIPVPVNGLAVDIATRAAAGNTSFQIRLDPAELGRIDVRLDVDKHGRVTSHLTVDQPATLDMLRKDAPQLQRALEDAGLKTGDGGLQFSLRDQSPQGGQNDSGQNRHSQRLIVSEDVSTTPQAVGASYGRSSGSSSGVDISI